MINKVLIVIFVFCFQIVNSQKQGSNNETNNKTSQIDFLKYSVDDLEGIVEEGHEGVYRNFDFSYTNGEAYFLLVPKIGAKKWYNIELKKYSNEDKEVDAKISKKLGTQGFQKLSSDFNIWVFFTDKKYLNYTPQTDAKYTPKIPRKTGIYYYKSQENLWEEVDSFSVLKDIDEKKEQNWREQFIDKLIQNDNDIDNIPNYIKAIEAGDFTLIKEKECDLNMDSFSDKILVFKNNKEFNPEDISTIISPIIILLNNGKNGYKKYQNDNVFPGTFQDIFKKLVVKDSFFTIELENEIPNQYFINKYITFKYDKVKKQINLHKYGENVNAKNKVYTLKEFGIIPFEEYNSSTIFDIISKTK